MKIKMLKTAAGPLDMLMKGKTVEVDDDRALSLIEAGAAEAVKSLPEPPVAPESEDAPEQDSDPIETADAPVPETGARRPAKKRPKRKAAKKTAK